jgi:ribosomal protein L29
VKGEVTVSDLREKTDAELLERKSGLEREMYVARSAATTGSEGAKARSIPLMRKEKARILTLLRERELKEKNVREPLL